MQCATQQLMHKDQMPTTKNVFAFKDPKLSTLN
jgi:hypothetical protein